MDENPDLENMWAGVGVCLTFPNQEKSMKTTWAMFLTAMLAGVLASAVPDAERVCGATRVGNGVASGGTSIGGGVVLPDSLKGTIG